MPKSSIGGVSDQNVDENYIAPPGVPPQDAIDRGLPDAGRGPEAQKQEKADDRSDDSGTEAGADGSGDVPRDAGKPAKRGSAGVGKRANGSASQR